MITLDDISNQFQAITQMLASPRIRNLVSPAGQFEMDELTYHLANFPGMVPYGTNIGLEVESQLGMFHLEFANGETTIFVRLHRPEPEGSRQFVGDLVGIGRLAPKIITNAAQVRIFGGLTPELWDGPFRPLNSSRLKRG